MLGWARSAAADVPGISLQAGLGTGVGYASLAGAYRDDTIGGLRAGLGIGPYATLDFALAEDLDRVEAATGFGARVRLARGDCWRALWTPYVRGQVSLVGASHLGSNYDLLVGAGHWGRLAPRVAWFAELQVVTRVGEYDSVAARVEVGLAVTTLAFWRD
nr:hypothetical protein [Kofleriaceae bacterium]